ncbi:MAG: hypothetical protein IPN42_08450 [Methylococcaceae bacterium]|nr:hypothetical protein [Methylococcaceae bacterium]
MKKILLTAIVSLALSQSAVAGTAGIAGLKLIQGVGIVNTTFFGHFATGVMQVRVQGGFVIPAGLTCTDTQYLDTLRSADPDRALFNLLRDAKTQRRNVLLYITDDTTKAASPGRCSLVAAEVL